MSLSSLMSMISQQIGSAQAAIPSVSKAKGGTTEDPREKENRAAYRKLLENALTQGNTAQIEALSPEAVAAGVDISPYRVAAGKPARSQKIDQAIERTFAEKLGLVEPGARNPLTDVGSPALDLQGAEPIEQQATPEALKQHLEALFTPEYTRQLLSKRAGLEVGPHYGEDGEWFQRLQEMRNQNPGVPMSQLVNNLIMQTGFAPDAASELKDLTPEQSDALAENVFGRYFHDPVVDAAVKKAFPKANQDLAKAGLILNQMRNENRKIPTRYQPILDRYDGLADDMQDIANKQTASEIKAKGFAEEEVDAKIFGGVAERHRIIKQIEHDTSKPRLSDSAVDQVTAALNFNDISEGAMNNIASFVEQGGIDALPTGPEELITQYMDKWGVAANQRRIQLRAYMAHYTQAIYNMRGKQISNVELDLALKQLPTMNDAPLAFVTKFKEFQLALRNGVKNTIAARKAAGYDVGDLEAFYEGMQKQPLLDAFLGNAFPKPKEGPKVEVIQPTPKAPSAPKQAPAKQPAKQAPAKKERIVSGSPDDDKKYTKGKTYEDALGNKAKYLGGGKWQLLSQ